MHTHTCPYPSPCFCPCIQHRLVSSGGMALPQMCRLTDQKRTRGTPACWHCCCQGMHSRSWETLESHGPEHSLQIPCGPLALAVSFPPALAVSVPPALAVSVPPALVVSVSALPVAAVAPAAFPLPAVAAPPVAATLSAPAAAPASVPFTLSVPAAFNPRLLPCLLGSSC